MATILPWVQIILSGILITLILIQQSSAGAGGAFGGGDGSGIQYTRRGAEKVIFNATVITAICFGLAAFAALFF
ncbi:MAG: preprotein translocase subunit SecG [Parcubacteria group bacterium]|nr:preprotein translocase subunit SecG [Parcubacteria group bacterium]